MIDLINQMLAPVRTKVANMVARAVVQLVNDGGKLQVLQLGVLDGETRSDVERLQEYGFTSVPKVGAEAVVLFPGGDRSVGLVVAVDDRRFRPKGLQDGEVALYDAGGTTVVLKANGDVEIRPKSGTVKVVGDVFADTISLKNHVHVPGAGEAAGPWPVVGNTGKPV